MITLTFPVSDSMGGDFDIEFDVTEEEYDKLAKAKNNKDDWRFFCDVEELTDLYNRLYKKAIENTVVECLEENFYADEEDYPEFADEDGEFDEDKAREEIMDTCTFNIDFPEEDL